MGPVYPQLACAGYTFIPRFTVTAFRPLQLQPLPVKGFSFVTVKSIRRSKEVCFPPLYIPIPKPKQHTGISNLCMLLRLYLFLLLCHRASPYRDILDTLIPGRFSPVTVISFSVGSPQPNQTSITCGASKSSKLSLSPMYLPRTFVSCPSITVTRLATLIALPESFSITQSSRSIASRKLE